MPRRRIPFGGRRPVVAPPPASPRRERLGRNGAVEAMPEEFLSYLIMPDQSKIVASEEPQTKRRKITARSYTHCDYIVVKSTTIALKFLSSGLQTPIRRQVSENVVVKLVNIGPTTYIVNILDISSRFDRQLLEIELTTDDIAFDDLGIAAIVAREAKDRQRLDRRGQGYLWTETDFELISDGSCDYLQVSLTIKWNITTSLDYVSPANITSPAVRAVFNAYFPDPHGRSDNKNPWSPQDFYGSVHVPQMDDTGAEPILTDNLETELYPFQKRAVRWLLEREGVQWSKKNGCTTITTDSTENLLSHGFYQAKDASRQACYMSALLGVVTKDMQPFRQLESLKGGILCEEMGLGKTVEMIALISLHKRKIEESTTVIDAYSLEAVRLSSATLIITPPSILRQWITELNRHAPSLKVMHYGGLQTIKGMDVSQFIQQMLSYDVVLTTYNVLSSEIHYTIPPSDRQLRQEKKNPRLICPLTQLQWWRVCLDEAQMIESGVSNAAKVARLIPRANSWAVTGTPLKSDITDLQGLLVFLRLQPYDSLKHFWASLVTEHRLIFRALFNRIALRHTKNMVRGELRLPPQQRFVITMPFTAIEEQYYQSLFEQMCEDCGVDFTGAPLTEDWDPEDSVVLECMRTWLVRLRQAALHPEIGGRNRRALGKKDGPLRTVDEVLDSMFELCDMSIRTDQRSLLLSKLKRGQLLENSPRVQEASKIWSDCLEEASAIVAENKEQLKRAIEMAKEVSPSTDDEDDSDIASAPESDDDSAQKSRVGTLRNRVRAALEVEHVAVFFCANAHFQIRSNENLTKPDTPEYKALEKLEVDGYERAKIIRQEILKEIFTKNTKLMRKLAKRASNQAFVQIPEIPTSPPVGGLESRRILESLDTLAVALDAQANQLDEWREATVQFLLKSLVDEDDNMEDITGEEYEQSTKTQEEVMVFVQALRAMIEDRHDALTGQENFLVSHDVKTSIRLAKGGDGAFPEKLLGLLKVRAELKPSKEMGSLRGIVSDLRGLATNLKLDAENGSARAANELAIVEKQRQRVQQQFNDQTKVVAQLRKEIEDFTRLMNYRLEFYRQLQQVSDMVAPFEGVQDPRLFLAMLASEDILIKKIATGKAKRRYLEHLKEEASNPAEQRMCVICQSSFQNGSLTTCGHCFCKECMALWWAEHHNCPVCKRRLIQADLHDITYKPQELKVAEESADIIPRDRSPTAVRKKSGIYSEISSKTLAEIQNIDLDGPSFTTKVDTLARHLLWLRENDPSTKSLIFSQFTEFLEVLGRALTRHRIGYSTINQPNGVEKFKQDPSTECFLLHAKAHSSGLNLVNASHVFLCEPLINTALELQAIARVDRIGQQQTTSVYLYIVEGTVEESIYDISVKRRMEHLDRSSKRKSKESTPELLDIDSSIEVANSLELQQAPLAHLLTRGRSGGEMVRKGDLWDCLFGNARKKQTLQSEVVDRAVARHLAAEAAEIRRLEELEGEIQ